MKGKIGWSIFWIVVVAVISFCAYTVTPYITGEKTFQPEEATASSSQQEDKESAPTTEEDQKASEFISHYHQILNDLTGWGRINNPNWDEVQLNAKQIVDSLDAMKYKGDSDLQKDFKDIRELAKDLETANNVLSTLKLRKLHRYLHDLDVVMNRADGDGKYYNMTKWGKANK
ncbi:hypothetical protein [Ectobacillus panaciterrae]|uniref:hypothetical protein n=1 Tax=Ectobacillus panaciterrae TaxID=363872 RepID=UPI0004151B2E|nr:hypothetical protein [Ectobacillus panaciterrae]